MSRTASLAFSALTLSLIALGLMLLSTGGYLQPIESLLLRPIGEVQAWLAVRFYAARDVLASPSDVAALRARVRELESENARLQQEIITLRERVTQAEVLSTLVQYARSQPENRYLAANVISRDASPFLRSVWIAAGTDDGVGHGMPVVTDRGLVGRIVEVHESVARIELMSDPDLSVNVLLQDSRQDAVVQAQLNGELWATLIDQEAEVKEGELVLTSGLGGLFPANIPVGQVINVRQRDFDLFQSAVLQSSVDFSHLEVVLVITSFRPLPFQDRGP